jgi:tRNA threonylcarbamoyladenosine biosynthesis protein TsaB
MPKILSLETSTPVCSVALHQDGQLKFLSEIHEDQSHAGKLTPLIDQALSISGWDANSLDAIAVSAGPGSYTGLRIGTSTAKGLCFALNVPLIAVDTLKLLAHKVRRLGFAAGYLCPMLDARRMEVYYSLFTPRLETVSPVQTLEVDAQAFDEVLNKEKVFFFGPGAEKCATVISHANAIFIKDVHPSAAEVGELAATELDHGKFQDLITFEPMYLKEFLVKKSTKIEKVMNK